jgi:hypothetical protein
MSWKVRGLWLLLGTARRVLARFVLGAEREMLALTHKSSRKWRIKNLA